MCEPIDFHLSDNGFARLWVPINDITPEIFRHLLHYIYGGTVEDKDLDESAKDIIDAADRTGVVSPKMEAEAYYILSNRINFLCSATKPAPKQAEQKPGGCKKPIPLLLLSLTLVPASDLCRLELIITYFCVVEV